MNNIKKLGNKNNQQTKWKQTVLTIDIIFSVLTLMLGVIFASHSTYVEKSEKILYLKGAASICFVVVGITNMIYALLEHKAKPFPILMACAFICGAVADIVLPLQVLAGGVIFAIGHILFICALSFLLRFGWKEVLCGLALAIPFLLVIFLTNAFDKEKVMQITNMIMIIAYCLLVCLFVGKAIINIASKANKTNIFILVGAILFLISDVMLFMYMCGSFGFKVNSCFVYYPAQVMVAMSMFFYVLEQPTKVNKKN